VTHHDWNDKVLKWKTGQSGLVTPNLLVHLFVNPVVPDCHVLAGVLVEPTDSGYSPWNVLYSDWTFGDYPASGDCGRVAQTVVHTWNFVTGNFTVYGCYIVDVANGVFAWTQAFDVPFNFPPGPGTMTLQLSDVQQQCP
jgi:hypothetical protein